MLEFEKMHGLGNDFIMLDNRKNQLENLSELSKKICDRHFGIGADGIIVAEESEKAEIKMLIFNSDGSQAPMCGNGMRCFAKYVFDNGYVKEKEFSVETLAGIMKPKVIIEDEEVIEVRVNLGKPIFNSNILPIKDERAPLIKTEIELEGNRYIMYTLIMGCIHSVVLVDNLENIDIKKIGPMIENHKVFPQKTNVNFCQIIDESNIKVITWEVGAGLTLACGTGSASVGVVSSILNNIDGKINIHLLGGIAEVEIISDEVFLTGPAALICRGFYCN